MKKTLIIKIILLLLPLIAAFVMYLINMDSDGIGGGYYDLTYLYYAVVAGIIYFVFCIVLMSKLTRENIPLLAVSVLLLLAHLIYLSKILR